MISIIEHFEILCSFCIFFIRIDILEHCRPNLELISNINYYLIFKISQKLTLAHSQN